MQTYQFTLPLDKGGAHSFLDKIALEFGGFTAWSGIGGWKAGTVEGTWHDTVEVEGILIVQVTTAEAELLRERVIAFLRNAGEQAAYFGYVGDHNVIDLNPKEA